MQSLVRTMTLAFGIGAGTVALAQEPTRPVPLPREGQPAVSDKAKAATDEMFARKAAAGGHAEVELAMLAQQKSANEKVKALAQRHRVRPQEGQRRADVSRSHSVWISITSPCRSTRAPRTSSRS